MSITTELDIKDESESDLISMASGGNADAFGILYEKYIDQIYNYIYFRTSNGKDAEDICSNLSSI